MPGTILGLDVGTNSVGWALIEQDLTGQPVKLIGLGSRIFQEAVDEKTRTPKNKHRRDKRQLRQTLRKRRQRRETLKIFLQGKGLLPSDDGELRSLLTDDKKFNPYSLRNKGLDQELSLHELGRIFYHINQRRGFLSNRKAELLDILRSADLPDILHLLEEEESKRTEEAVLKAKARAEKVRVKGQSRTPASEDEESIFKAAIAHTREGIRSSGARTLGEFLFHQPKKRSVVRADRKMYEDEFNALWKTQARHHPQSLTTALQAEIHHIIFFQNPLRSQKFLVGPCSYEPRRKRAARALLEAQKARILQDVNGMEVVDTHTGESAPLTEDQRTLLLAALMADTTRHFGPKQDKAVAGALNDRGIMTWGKVRRLLGIDADKEINLERGGNKDLIGDRTTLAMRKVLGIKWDLMPLDQKRALLTDILTIDRKDALIRRCLGRWRFNSEESYGVATTEIEPGYAAVSMKLLRRVLPHLERGLKWHVALSSAGYTVSQNGSAIALEGLPLPPQLRNPVVMKALHETRKVVNAVITRWGKPAVLRLELAREVKFTGKRLAQLEKMQAANKKANDQGKTEISRWSRERPEYDAPALPKGEDCLKYRLWKEQGERCLYTGNPISPAMLFSGEVEVDHILPLSLSVDDSYMNKALCFSTANQKKGQRTPMEWLAKDDPDRWRAVMERIKPLPYAKKMKFDIEKVVLDEFAAKQLSDTQYIARAAKDYLGLLGVPVETTKGAVTAKLRGLLDLNRLLSTTRDSIKNRADHRHHAVDAVVVALTTRSLLQKVANSYKAFERTGRWKDVSLDSPWRTFQTELSDALGNMVVSHAPNRKVYGALLKETAYGFDKGRKVFVSRSPIFQLDAKVIRQEPGKNRWIVDDEVRRILVTWLDAGHVPEEAASHPPVHKDGKTPILKVRLAEHRNTGGMVAVEGYKHYPKGSNHHIEIVENIKTKERRGCFVAMFDAAQRIHPLKGQPKLSLVQRDHGPDWEFKASLCINDMVELEDGGRKTYYRVQKLSDPQVVLRLHTAATLENKEEGFAPTVRHFPGRKIAVDPLGFFTYAHD